MAILQTNYNNLLKYDHSDFFMTPPNGGAASTAPLRRPGEIAQDGLAKLAEVGNLLQKLSEVQSHETPQVDAAHCFFREL